MTIRNPNRGYLDDSDTEESDTESEILGLEAEQPQDRPQDHVAAERSTSSLPHSSPEHPVLTDFGPVSMVTYFREKIENIKSGNTVENLGQEEDNQRLDKFLRWGDRLLPYQALDTTCSTREPSDQNLLSVGNATRLDQDSLRDTQTTNSLQSDDEIGNGLTEILLNNYYGRHNGEETGQEATQTHDENRTESQTENSQLPSKKRRTTSGQVDNEGLSLFRGLTTDNPGLNENFIQDSPAKDLDMTATLDLLQNENHTNENHANEFTEQQAKRQRTTDDVSLRNTQSSDQDDSQPADLQVSANGGSEIQDRALVKFDYDNSFPEVLSAQLIQDFLQSFSNTRHFTQSAYEALADFLHYDNISTEYFPEHEASSSAKKLLTGKTSISNEQTLPLSMSALNDAETSYHCTYLMPSFFHQQSEPIMPRTRAICVLFVELGNEIWDLIVRSLSIEDIHNLRLANKTLAQLLAPILMRNVVVSFGKSFFTDQVGIPQNLMLENYGNYMNKFGISFDYDQTGLTYAESKVMEKEQDAWYGTFTWPISKYPRFSALKEMEDLVDNNRDLFKDAFRHLDRTSELGLSVDSGHGWIEGPDISDLALFNLRANKGNKVFGKTFGGENCWVTFSRNEYFKWAQQNTVTENLKEVMKLRPTYTKLESIEHLKGVVIRDHDSYRVQSKQIDHDEHAHTGGVDSEVSRQSFANLSNPNQPAPVTVPAREPLATLRRRLHRARHPAVEEETSKDYDFDDATVFSPQWPLIFNGYSISGELGGHTSLIQDRLARPTKFPLLPGDLTEAQAQWLMETLWSQRAFLSAYTTAVITNKRNLENIHSLTISKLSSGLLPSLSHHEFWSSLPGLRTLKILVKPDWRQEHIAGDKSFSTNMLLSPVLATTKFAEFLQLYISRVEQLSSLTIGYVGGGEQGIGMYARNQNVLPAPLTKHPRAWITDHRAKPNPATLLKFDHIRDLKLENCWLSPCMLKCFMKKSRDTSLRNLTLDSVSLLSQHDSGIDGPLTTVANSLSCQYAPEGWLRENLPTSACWTEVLDKITPGITLLERKHTAGLLESTKQSMPVKEFRGNIQKIVLKSCGYVKISGVKGDEFNQNALVMQLQSPMDGGLLARRAFFEKGVHTSYGMLEDEEEGEEEENANDADDDNDNDDNDAAEPPPPPLPLNMPHTILQHVRNRSSLSSNNDSKRVMLSTIDPSTGMEYFGLGRLTQCIHPIEKRVLEQAWNMQFGWGDNMERWAAVEDGFYEGGTGRFSGVITKDDNDDDNNEANDAMCN